MLVLSLLFVIDYFYVSIHPEVKFLIQAYLLFLSLILTIHDSLFSFFLFLTAIFVKGCSAVTNEGMEEAFTTVVRQIRLKNNGELPPGFITLPIPENEQKKEEEVAASGKEDGHFSFLKKMFDISYLKSILFY